MSELLLSITRLGFLALLWWFVLSVTSVLRNDLLAPRDAKPLTPVKTFTPPSRRTVLRKNNSASRIVITHGTFAGTTIPLGSTPITIGRAPDSTVVLNDGFTSTHHAIIARRGDHWVIEDLDSTNGTLVNGEKITDPTILKRKASVHIGETILELR